MEILNAIVSRVPPPKETADKPLRALIFDRCPLILLVVFFQSD